MSQPQPYLPAPGARTPLAPARPEQAPRRTRRESVVALSGVPLFAGMPRRHLQRLAREADELTFGPGETIVQEGLLGETLFVVLEGHAKVTRNRRRVGQVVPGDFFGELSALDGGARTASVIAETPMRVLRLFRRTLTGLLREDPQLAIKVLEGVVRRVREVQRRID